MSLYTLPPACSVHLVREELDRYLPSVLVNLCTEYFVPNQWRVTRGTRVLYLADGSANYTEGVVVQVDPDNSVHIVLLNGSVPPCVCPKSRVGKLKVDETQHVREPMSEEELNALTELAQKRQTNEAVASGINNKRPRLEKHNHTPDVGRPLGVTRSNTPVDLCTVPDGLETDPSRLWFFV